VDLQQEVQNVLARTLAAMEKSVPPLEYVNFSSFSAAGSEVERKLLDRITNKKSSQP
jgi:hypothetical protein